jgi:hypothetical protein
MAARFAFWNKKTRYKSVFFLFPLILRFSIKIRSEGDQEVEDVGEKPENVRKA